MIDTINVREAIETENGCYAALVREKLKKSNTYLINLMGSPGAGKSSVLLYLASLLKDRIRIGVMEADVDSDVDARLMENAGLLALQLHTGGACHMDAKMTLEGLEHLPLESLDLVVLENVGNLVCPAEFDVGANKKVTILSVPEGDDKPLKYPLMFQVTDCLLVNKMDAAPIFDFDLTRLRENVKPLHPGLPVYPVSARTGAELEAVATYLLHEMERT